MSKVSHLIKTFWSIIYLEEGQRGIEEDRGSKHEAGGCTQKTESAVRQTVYTGRTNVHRGKGTHKTA